MLGQPEYNSKYILEWHSMGMIMEPSQVRKQKHPQKSKVNGYSTTGLWWRAITLKYPSHLLCPVINMIWLWCMKEVHEYLITTFCVLQLESKLR